MKNKSLVISIALIVVGIAARMYGDNASYVDATGLVHDSMWTPLGTLLAVIGVIWLFVIGIQAGIKALRK